MQSFRAGRQTLIPEVPICAATLADIWGLLLTIAAFVSGMNSGGFIERTDLLMYNELIIVTS
jgi:hypothetical protein